jgi:hypothetical protein
VVGQDKTPELGASHPRGGCFWANFRGEIEKNIQGGSKLEIVGSRADYSNRNDGLVYLCDHQIGIRSRGQNSSLVNTLSLSSKKEFR